MDPKSNIATLASDSLTHFRILLNTDCKVLLQTWKKVSLSCPDQVLLLFKKLIIFRTLFFYVSVWDLHIIRFNLDVLDVCIHITILVSDIGPLGLLFSYNLTFLKTSLPLFLG